MSALAFTQLFLFFLILTLIVRFWLAVRQLHTVKKFSDNVPKQFAGRITLPAHQKAAAYTIAKTRFSLVSLTVDTVVLLGFTLFGGLQYLAGFISAHISNDMICQIALIFAVCIIAGMFDLPLDYYRKFDSVTLSGRHDKKRSVRHHYRAAGLVDFAGHHGKNRNMVVALRLDSLERFPVSDAFHLPDIHRPAIQQIFPPDR